MFYTKEHSKKENTFVIRPQPNGPSFSKIHTERIIARNKAPLPTAFDQTFVCAENIRDKNDSEKMLEKYFEGEALKKLSWICLLSFLL